MGRLKVKTNLSRCLGDAQEEHGHRELTTKAMITAMRAVAKPLLDTTAAIDDKRGANKLKYKKESLILFALVMSTLRLPSLREAARAFSANGLRLFLRAFGMGATEPPHTSTLTRFFKGVEPDILDKANLRIVSALIRKKKFEPFKAPHGKYLIAVDGTGLHSSKICWSKNLLHKTHKHADGHKVTTYSVYGVHANMVFSNGLSLPLMSEILDNDREASDGKDGGVDATSMSKQDCEQVGFKRLSIRLKAQMPKVPIMMLMDGLYPNEPVMKGCRDNNWDYMIVLKDDSCPAIWAEAKQLRTLMRPNEDTCDMTYNGRHQHFWWVNALEREVEEKDCSGRTRRLMRPVNLVVCEESWSETDSKGEATTKTSKHAWLSGEPITRSNVHSRCNLSARVRWGIEESNRREKTLGFGMEHAFSKDWNAYRCYHHMLRLGELVNAIALMMTCLAEIISRLGETGVIRLLRDTLCSGLLTASWYEEYFAKPLQLRL